MKVDKIKHINDYYQKVQKIFHTIMFKIRFCLLIGILPLQIQAQDKVLDAMKTEANRSLAIFKEEPVPAYYISYRIQDKETFSVATRFGKLQSNNQRREGFYRMMIRVGNHEMDNTRKVGFRSDADGIFGEFPSASYLPIEEDPFALRMKLWENVNETYRYAVREYERIKTTVGVNAEVSDQSDDFTHEIPEQYYEAPLGLKFDAQKWEKKLKMYSQVFDNNKDLLEGSANLNVELVRNYFVDTDGAVIAQNRCAFRLSLTVRTIADDGMVLPLYQSYFSMEEKDLPSDAAVIADAQKISKLASQLKNAPVAESYSGPAIMSSKASGVFFHEIFGHRIEGARMKQESDAQTFKKKVGEAVLPEDISVIFDPQLKKYRGMQLSGSYVFDDEGVRGKRVMVVENGVLKSFLMSRTPIDGFPKSNGHGRGDVKHDPETRQSNMLIESSNPKSDGELRNMLISEIKRTGKEYGYLFDEVSGGFTSTGRFTPNAFNVTPLVVYRIYADGRPDELVRGIDLIGTPLSMFSQVVACGNQYDVFNGYCGATSGSIPVSCVSPSLFVKMIETQKKSKSTSKPPVLERP